MQIAGISSQATIKNATVLNGLPYVIFNPVDDAPHVANESGWLGLGPYTTDNGTERGMSTMYRLQSANMVNKNIVTYNITFRADAKE